MVKKPKEAEPLEKGRIEVCLYIGMQEGYEKWKENRRNKQKIGIKQKLTDMEDLKNYI